MRWATYINTDPSCIWITNSDMALGSSLHPENNIVLNGSPSHSDQDDARKNMTLDTSETTGCSPNPRLHVAFDSNIGCGHQHRPLSCGRTMDPNTVLGDGPDHWKSSWPSLATGAMDLNTGMYYRAMDCRPIPWQPRLELSHRNYINCNTAWIIA